MINVETVRVNISAELMPTMHLIHQPIYLIQLRQSNDVNIIKGTPINCVCVGGNWWSVIFKKCDRISFGFLYECTRRSALYQLKLFARY